MQVLKVTRGKGEDVEVWTIDVDGETLFWAALVLLVVIGAVFGA
jgi:hypothetical protein